MTSSPFTYFYSNYFEITKIVLAITITIIIALAEKIIFRKLYPKLQKSTRIWDDALLYSIHMPLKFSIYFAGIATLITVFFEKFTLFSSWINSIYHLAAPIFFIWTLTRFIKKFEENYSTPQKINKYDPTTITGVIQVLKVFVFSIVGLIVLQLMGIPLSGVIAFGGIGGIAVGFAAKDLLANFFGGLMIFLDRPFIIGDWIRSPDKEIEGSVEHIGWRHTRIRTFDKRPLFVPNSIFSTITIENPSRMTNRRIRARFELSYEDSSKISLILRDIDAMLRNHPEIDTRQPLYVNLIEFGPYSLKAEVYTFTKTTQWLKFQNIQQEIFLKILDVIHGHDAKCAYPITAVQVPERLNANSHYPFEKEPGKQKAASPL